MVSFGFVALRCADLEKSRRFYEVVGLTFVAEQHGQGPPHLSSDLGGVVLDLYPARSDGERADLATVGLTVSDLEGLEDRLRAAGYDVECARGSATLVVPDPDGRRVRISSAG